MVREVFKDLAKVKFCFALRAEAASCILKDLKVLLTRAHIY